MSLFKKDKEELQKKNNEDVPKEFDEMKQKFMSESDEITAEITPLLKGWGSLDELKLFSLQLKELNQKLINKKFTVIGIDETIQKVDDNINILEKVYKETGRKIILWCRKEYKFHQELDKPPYFKFIYIDDRDMDKKDEIKELINKLKNEFVD
jgi:hypothetical protein